jgi:hypothetical protein
MHSKVQWSTSVHNQDEHHNELVDTWIDISPPSDNDNGMDHNGNDDGNANHDNLTPISLRFSMINTKTITGQTLTRHSSTWSSASQSRKTSIASFQESNHQAISHYDADDKSEEGPTSSSSLSTMSSVSSPVHANNTFIGHPHLDYTHILACQPYFGSLLGMDEEEEREAAEVEGQEKDDKSPTLGTSYSYPVWDAFANLPPLSPLLAALVELYQISKISARIVHFLTS